MLSNTDWLAIVNCMEISLKAETLFHVGSLPVTNSVLTTWVVMILLVLIGLLARRVRLIPRGVQNVVEMVVVSLYDLIKPIINNDKVTRRIFPLLGVLFVFILISNWAGLLPGVGSIGVRELHEGKEILVPLFRAPTSDLNTTFALAVISVVVTTVLGVAIIGPVSYTKKFIRLTSPIDFFIGIFEMISELSRLLSYSFRLFGNIFAGEVMISVITFLIPWVIPAPLYAFELFVGFIQAFVFVVLTALFISLAIVDHDAHPHDQVEAELQPSTN